MAIDNIHMKPISSIGVVFKICLKLQSSITMTIIRINPVKVKARKEGARGMFFNPIFDCIFLYNR